MQPSAIGQRCWCATSVFRGLMVTKSRDEFATFHLHACLLIAVSGYGDSTDRERARAAGFSHHITKPADPVLLAELIAKSASIRGRNAEVRGAATPR